MLVYLYQYNRKMLIIQQKTQFYSAKRKAQEMRKTWAIQCNRTWGTLANTKGT